MKIYDYKEMNLIPRAWYSVKDYLPPIGVEVIVLRSRDKKITALARYIPCDGVEGEENYFWDNNYGGHNTHLSKGITYWSPMPTGETIKAGSEPVGRE